MVARRHGLTPQQVFGWRREARRALEAVRASTSSMGFVPAVIAEPNTKPSAAPVQRPQRSRRRAPAAAIELELSGVAVRVGPDASEAQIVAVIRALKASA
jgi:transposase